MDISTATVLVTGANRGLGRALTQELVARGATVYGAARRPDRIDLPGVKAIRLDVTDPASVAAAAEEARDVTVLINNAGSSTGADLLTGDLDAVRLEMETHYLGTLRTIRAFAPVIESRGGGAILNILSVLSWISFPSVGAYAAAKSAQWSLTNTLRQQLAPRDITVSGLHVGYMDTDMAGHVEGPKNAPADVARAAVDGIASGAAEILVDDLSRKVRADLAGGVAALYPQHG
ncbi:short-chain dehydrogenase [Streptomyces sp. CB09001]|uniref:SDR family oxidoreductase n=1 Tax=unclassified Streptomyces TaxID=2593676 RepID=UPI000E21357C|nr:SDR family oxidoreductase [Streptomyces sp. CB09001]AXL93133.1 short-chain dehydrogenase [Streptomyces sp. CB09001]